MWFILNIFAPLFSLFQKGLNVVPLIIEITGIKYYERPFMSNEFVCAESKEGKKSCFILVIESSVLVCFKGYSDTMWNCTQIDLGLHLTNCFILTCLWFLLVNGTLWNWGFFSVEYRGATEGEVTGRFAERSEGRSGSVPPRQPHPTQIRLQYSCSFSCSGKKQPAALT